ncbi:hypothetical protein [Paenibacillus sp. MMS20-IR301]|uniref:hypothetical protein n=1 Tax=Paenibacillus sp. MMS20-IR301 TaxID=2895946 RepID=UPI0028EA137D|nr:hypothetical protein [Paenibacillus sp. MMS20-IR301]WNS46402.1 hypothetical protein LOS79_14450 [Paenibacillus sp. MMS20-IR301]
MIISLIFVALSGVMGAGMYFLVIGIVFSIGGGDLPVATDYNQLSFYLVLLLACLVICFFFAKHLIERNLHLLLLVCFSALVLFFILAHWLGR